MSGEAGIDRLWEEAQLIFYNDIGEDKAEKLRDTTTLQDTIKNLKTSQTRVSKEYGTHSIKMHGKSMEFNIGKIMQRLELLLQVGDTAMNFAPEALSLVWAAFRMIFTGFLIDQETCQLLIDSVNQVSDIIFFCEIYARRHLKQNSIIQAAGSIVSKVLEQIPPIYAAILRFSYETRRLVKHNKFSRS